MSRCSHAMRGTEPPNDVADRRSPLQCRTWPRLDARPDTATLADLRRRFPAAVRALDPAGRLWVAWPKRAARVDTDLTFEIVQRLGLDAELVDNKSASVDDVYQGPQFVIRLRDRAIRTAEPPS